MEVVVVLIVKLKASSAVAAAAARNRSEADAHILIRDHIGVGWMVLAATIDVTKAGLYPLAARRFGGLPDEWVALCMTHSNHLVLPAARRGALADALHDTVERLGGVVAPYETYLVLARRAA